jgi:hypothetical protein
VPVMQVIADLALQPLRDIDLPGFGPIMSVRPPSRPIRDYTSAGCWKVNTSLSNTVGIFEFPIALNDSRAFPPAFRTAMEMLSLCTSIPIYLGVLVIKGCAPFRDGLR